MPAPSRERPTNSKLTVSWLIEAVTNHAALRRVRRLQPVGGVGDKLFPPTYPPPQGAPKGTPPRHVFERRRLDAGDVWCVLIDSVQSQANRLEEALLAASRKGAIQIPYVTVDFRDADLDPLEEITSLDAPHRVYDAILRDSTFDRKPFMQSQAGKRLAAAKPADATALLELSPTALLFGVWHSQGEGGGLGAKFPRAMVSEIMGIDTPVDDVPNPRTGEIEHRTAGQRTGSRIDPLGILRSVEVFKGKAGWSPEQKAAGAGAKKVRPSEINHGNIAPTVQPLGVTCAYAEHRTVVTLAGLRRLRFGSNERNDVGRALIAALGLVALAEQDAAGYALRSRCDLVCDGPAPLELVQADGQTVVVNLDTREQARTLYHEAYARAESAGFRFRSITLKPQEKLVEIVRRSRELALEGKGGEETDNS